MGLRPPLSVPVNHQSYPLKMDLCRRRKKDPGRFRSFEPGHPRNCRDRDPQGAGRAQFRYEVWGRASKLGSIQPPHQKKRHTPRPKWGQFVHWIFLLDVVKNIKRISSRKAGTAVSNQRAVPRARLFLGNTKTTPLCGLFFFVCFVAGFLDATTDAPYIEWCPCWSRPPKRPTLEYW